MKPVLSFPDYALLFGKAGQSEPIRGLFRSFPKNGSWLQGTVRLTGKSVYQPGMIRFAFRISFAFFLLISALLKPLNEMSNRSWGLQHFVVPPRRSDIAQYCDYPQKVDEKMGGSRGFSPWAASPSLGREGVTLIVAKENKVTQKKEDFNKALISYIPHPQGCIS
jgi:hypothetical protein